MAPFALASPLLQTAKTANAEMSKKIYIKRFFLVLLEILILKTRCIASVLKF